MKTWIQVCNDGGDAEGDPMPVTCAQLASLRSDLPQGWTAERIPAPITAT